MKRFCYSSDLSENKKKKKRVKIELSTHESTSLVLEKLGIDERITRTQFEEINAELFRRALIPVKNVLELAHFEPSEVAEVALVGGTTRIPKIRKILHEYFGKPPNTSINPEEAVAIGTGFPEKKRLFCFCFLINEFAN